MKPPGTYLPGNVLPTVVVATVLMLAGIAGLLALWEHETLLFARSCRLRQARADAESAYALYRLYPACPELTGRDGYLLYDSLPLSRVFVEVRPWGLYETVTVTTSDSLLRVCRLCGAWPDAAKTLFYADGRSAVTLAGKTELHGTLGLPRNGLVYGRVGSDFFCGTEIPRAAIGRSGGGLPEPDADAVTRIAALFAARPRIPHGTLPDSLWHSFLRDSAAVFGLEDAEVGDCSLRGRIVLYADELRIDSACRMGHLLVCARKVTVGCGARIAAQLFALSLIHISEPTRP